MANEGLAFARGLTDRFIQFKMLNRARRIEEARQKRFDQQLQDNRRFNQERLKIAQQNADTAAVRALQPPISIFTPHNPNQIEDRTDAFKVTTDVIPTKTEGGFLGFGGKGTVLRSDINKAKDFIGRKFGTTFRGSIKGKQDDFVFNQLIGDRFHDFEIIEDIREDGSIVEPQTNTFPKAKTFGGGLFTNVPPSQRGAFIRSRAKQPTQATPPSTATSTATSATNDSFVGPPAPTFPNATQSRAALLAEFKRLGGSKSPEAQQFAIDNGLLE